jgi:glucose/arabinose dehydrogenase/mono/diheme cytochrome c family protein
MKRFFFLLPLFCALRLFAQNGDKAGEAQNAPAIPTPVPEAPALTPEQALKSFHLQPGFKLEVVASEPMIEAPIQIAFAPDGRMYVLEMRGFMRSIDGAGEDEPLGRVSLLEDTDGDGRMDKSTVFVDGLVMPRAIAFVRGGLLVAEPPHLWVFRDENGDGKAEKKEEISNDYGNQKSPEHTANGLLWGRDNWIYSADHTIRYRNIRGYWEKDVTEFRGQWGITQDDYGRLFYNSNSDQLRGDLVPGQYLLRNPNFKSPFGVNVQLVRDQSTFPGRVNPGVNRGYQKGTLRADGTLAQFTAACAPCIYRGELFPAKFYGAAFLCEPAGNFVRCNFLSEREGLIAATNAFPSAEFLTSTDERFRPVNLLNGPDGALYVVDMYRGVLQHKIFVTTYLRNQALSRGLDKPLNLGRIYRVVPTDAPRSRAKNLASLDSPQLVQALTSTNGWVRDAAQQLLVEKNDFQSYDALNELAAKGEFPSAIHALWVLSAVGELNTEPLLGALKSAHPKVRATAIRVGEPFLRAEGKNEVGDKIMALASDPSFEVKLQLMFSLGESKTAETNMLDLLNANVEHRLIRDAAISGLKGRELSFLSKLVKIWPENSPGKESVIRTLAECIAQSRDAGSISQLLDLLSADAARWQQYAMLDGINALLPKGRAKENAPPKPVRLPSEPAAFAKLKAQPDAGLQTRVGSLNDLLVWPGKPGYNEVQVAPLTADEQKRFDAGKAQFLVICGACHQPTGLGQEGLAPPLVDSEWVNGPPERIVRIVLNGVRGKLNVKGKNWELEMPPLNILPDEDIANLLTYIRREWGHTASPVAPDFVGKIRAQTADRESAWTEPELLRIK